MPALPGAFIRRPVEQDTGDEAVPEREAVVGRWGLISALTKAEGLDKAGKLSTLHARSETAAESAEESRFYAALRPVDVPQSYGHTAQKSL